VQVGFVLTHQWENPVVFVLTLGVETADDGDLAVDKQEDSFRLSAPGHRGSRLPIREGHLRELMHCHANRMETHD
jgi:hypothetical protein